MQKTNDKTDSIIAVVLALLVYIPGSSIGNILRLGIVVVVFVMKHMNEHAEPGIRKVALFMVLSPFISVIFVMMFEGFGVNWALVIHEVQRMLFCAFLLMTVAKLHISFRLIYIIAIIILIPRMPCWRKSAGKTAPGKLSASAWSSSAANIRPPRS